jgi:hypothetical protein
VLPGLEREPRSVLLSGRSRFDSWRGHFWELADIGWAWGLIGRSLRGLLPGVGGSLLPIRQRIWQAGVSASDGVRSLAQCSFQLAELRRNLSHLHKQVVLGSLHVFNGRCKEALRHCPNDEGCRSNWRARRTAPTSCTARRAASSASRVPCARASSSARKPGKAAGASSMTCTSLLSASPVSYRRTRRTSSSSSIRVIFVCGHRRSRILAAKAPPPSNPCATPGITNRNGHTP